MFLLIYGEDTFRSRKTLSAMRERFLETRDPSGMNALRFSGDDFDAALEAVFASPFLAEKKLVILEGFLRLSKKDQERMLSALEKKPATTNVIFFEALGTEELKDSPLFSALAKQPFSVESKKMSQVQMAQAIADYGKSREIVFTREALAVFSAFYANDFTKAMLEASKACDYAAAMGRREISGKDMAVLAAKAEQVTVFAFLDAVTEGRKNDALTILHKLQETGESEHAILQSLVKHFRNIFGASDLIARKAGDADTVAKKAGIHPFAAKKIFAAAQKKEPAAWRRRHAALIDIEAASKTGAKTLIPLLERFIMTE